MAPRMQTVIGSELRRRKRGAYVKLEKAILQLKAAMREAHLVADHMSQHYRQAKRYKAAKTAVEVANDLTESHHWEGPRLTLSEFNNLPED